MNFKEQVMSGIKPEIKEVPMPEWGEDVIVHLRTVTALDRDRFELDMIPLSGFEDMDTKGKDADIKRRSSNLSARWLALCICDLEGNRLFVTEDEINKLGELDAEGIDKLRKISQEMNGVDNDIEELAKNLEAEASDS